jgi:predicted  nucleic acid-binding Zn-ribbon protein
MHDIIRLDMSEEHCLQALEEDEDAKRLIKDIRGLKHRCQTLEAQADSLGLTNCELQTALADREEQLQRQAHVIADLEATITAQSSDIRTALQLVSPPEYVINSENKAEGPLSAACGMRHMQTAQRCILRRNF